MECSTITVGSCHNCLTSYTNIYNTYAYIFYSVSRVRIEFYRFPPDKLFDILLSARWLLEVKTERPGANRFLIDIVKGCQVWVTKSLINFKNKIRIFSDLKGFYCLNDYSDFRFECLARLIIIPINISNIIPVIRYNTNKIVKI